MKSVMTASRLLARPPGHDDPVSTEVPDGSQPVVYTGRLLNHDVVVKANRPLPVEAIRLLNHLDQQWDVRRPHSDWPRSAVHAPKCRPAIRAR